MIAIIRKIVLAESESPAVRTASRALLAAVVAVAVPLVKSALGV